jgi:hypothetical protein
MHSALFALPALFFCSKIHAHVAMMKTDLSVHHLNKSMLIQTPSKKYRATHDVLCFALLCDVDASNSSASIEQHPLIKVPYLVQNSGGRFVGLGSYQLLQARLYRLVSLSRSMVGGGISESLSQDA